MDEEIINLILELEQDYATWIDRTIFTNDDFTLSKDFKRVYDPFYNAVEFNIKMANSTQKSTQGGCPQWLQ